MFSDIFVRYKNGRKLNIDTNKFEIKIHRVSEHYKRHFGDRDDPKKSRCLGVFNLGRRTTEEEFRRIFERYGRLEVSFISANAWSAFFTFRCI